MQATNFIVAALVTTLMGRVSFSFGWWYYARTEGAPALA